MKRGRNIGAVTDRGEGTITELADRLAREHDHFTVTRNGRADVMLISVAEYESMQETLDILGYQDAVADLRQSRVPTPSGRVNWDLAANSNS